MFTQHKINGCNCWENGDFRIVQQKGTQVFSAYKACSWDDDGNITSYSTVQKIVTRIEKHPDRDEKGKAKKDGQGNTVMVDVPVHGAKEYATLEEAMADCV